MASETRPEQALPPAENAAAAVLIQVPAEAGYLDIIRSASAHVATKAGCTLPEVADLRLAVDEAGGLLLRYTVRDWSAGHVPDLECRFVLGQAELRVVLSVPALDAVRPDPDEFGWTILSALVDDIDWRTDGATVRVEILKRRTAGG